MHKLKESEFINLKGKSIFLNCSSLSTRNLVISLSSLSPCLSLLLSTSFALHAAHLRRLTILDSIRRSQISLSSLCSRHGGCAFFECGEQQIYGRRAFDIICRSGFRSLAAIASCLRLERVAHEGVCRSSSLYITQEKTKMLFMRSFCK